MLFDSGAKVSILDTTFSHKVGCVIDEPQTQECVGIGESADLTVGWTEIKITLTDGWCNISTFGSVIKSTKKPYWVWVLWFRQAFVWV